MNGPEHQEFSFLGGVRGRIHGLFLLAFLILTGAGSVLTVWKSFSETETPGLFDSINGKWASAYERSFDSLYPSRNASIGLWGILEYAIFGTGRKGVIVGDAGWLFTDEEFEKQPGSPEELRRKIRYVVDVRDFLESRDVRLVVALIPSKSRIYGNYLGKHAFPSYKQDIYSSFEEALTDNDVVVVDLLQTFLDSDERDTLFLRTDTHWTPEGAKKAASAIAKSVRRDFPRLEMERTRFHTVRKGGDLHKGDLLRYVSVGDLGEWLGLKADTLGMYETVPESSENTDGTAEESLFGDVSIPVTLVGTSYSANPLWNFEGFLKESLGTDVLNAAEEGRGPFLPVEKYLTEDDSFQTSPPKVLVWEIPERYLTFAYDLKALPNQQ